jgi:transposase
MRVGGKTQWLRVACTPALTYHTVHPKRGPEGIRDAGILPEFQGIAVHDHWHPYFSGSDSCSHALCNAHHLRELKSVCEQYGQAWAGELSGLLTEIHREVRKNRPAADVLPACRIAESESRYDRLIEEGMSVNPRSEKISGRRGKQKQSPPRNLPNRLKGKKTEVLRFMYDFRVPFDNNQAERDIRMVRVRQKVSGSFRTQEGANIFSEIRGYVSTAEKNAFSVIEAIQRAFEGNPFVPTPA